MHDACRKRGSWSQPLLAMSGPLNGCVLCYSALWHPAVLAAVHDAHRTKASTLKCDTYRKKGSWSQPLLAMSWHCQWTCTMPSPPCLLEPCIRTEAGPMTALCSTLHGTLPPYSSPVRPSRLQKSLNEVDLSLHKFNMGCQC